MSRLGTELPKEYSDRFDELRQNRVEVSYYKYGTASDNFGMKLVNALESHEDTFLSLQTAEKALESPEHQ